MKWFFDEPHSAAAVDFLRGNAGALLGPALLASEVCATFVREHNAGRRADLAELLARFGSLIEGEGIRLVQASYGDTRGAALLAATLRHPLADCVYLHLAMVADLPLVTFDRKFAEKASTQWPRVEVLA